MSAAAMFLSQEVPTNKHERYKYTDFGFLQETSYQPSVRMSVEHLHKVVARHRLQQESSKLLVIVNGYYSLELSDKDLPAGLVVTSLNEALTTHPDLIRAALAVPANKTNYPFASLNATQFQDGLLLYVPDNQQVDTPIQILSVAVGEASFYTQARNIICIGENSSLHLFYEYISDTIVPYVMNNVDVVTLGDNAKLELNKCQHESVKANHLAHTFICQQKNSSVVYNCFAVGGHFYRDEVIVDLLASGAECKTGGFYRLTNDGQYIDNHVDINHHAPHSSSEMIYKGVLDKKSRAVFNGRLYIEKNAQKIVAQQQNHHILLGKHAEVYAKPELEIYADDVKCKHGATTGQIDQEALFYMRSRGIAQTDAMDILLHGFAEELLQKISSPEIKENIKNTVRMK